MVELEIYHSRYVKTKDVNTMEEKEYVEIQFGPKRDNNRRNEEVRREESNWSVDEDDEEGQSVWWTKIPFSEINNGVYVKEAITKIYKEDLLERNKRQMAKVLNGFSMEVEI